MFDKPRRNNASSLRPVDPVVANVMRKLVSCQTDEGLNAQFGLSYNTWRKIRAGQPIRASVAERVEMRMRNLIA